jgi:hypothetical protein
MENFFCIELNNINGVHYCAFYEDTVTLYFGKCHPDQVMAQKEVSSLKEATEMLQLWCQVHQLD